MVCALGIDHLSHKLVRMEKDQAQEIAQMKAASASKTADFLDQPKDQQVISSSTVGDTTAPTYKTTVVTAYFQIRSKYLKENYMDWMSLMLSIQDPMIVFTTEDWVQPIQELRKHALDRTHFVVMNLEDVPMAKDFSTTIWDHQLKLDPEAKRHAGYQVFWVWLSKTYFATEGIKLNPYNSEIFMWSDIGCFRGGHANKYKSKLLVQHPEVVPHDRMLFLSHKDEPSPPDSLWWTNKLKDKDHFYHSGSQMVGYKDTFQKFHEAFLKTLQGFLDRDMFLGDDQTVLQCTCTQNPDLCAYAKRAQVKPDNHYFGLRHIVFMGGKYDFWYPPSLPK